MYREREIYIGDQPATEEPRRSEGHEERSVQRPRSIGRQLELLLTTGAPDNQLREMQPQLTYT